MSPETWEWHGKAPPFEPMHSTCPLFARKLAPETQDAFMAALWPERVHAERERTTSVLCCMECLQRLCACDIPGQVACLCDAYLFDLDYILAFLLVQFRLLDSALLHHGAQGLSSTLRYATS